jgi:sialidase-1
MWAENDGVSLGTMVFDDYTKTIFLFFVGCSHVYATGCARTKFLTKSSDEGRTWSKPVNITTTFAADLPGIWSPGPATGIQTSNYTLLVCGSYRAEPKYSSKPPIPSEVRCLKSIDYGETWLVAGSVNYTKAHQPNEVQPAMLYNGSVLLNMRDVGSDHGFRLLARSDDNGGTFSPAWQDNRLVDAPSTQGSMLRVGNCLFLTNLGESLADRAHNDPCTSSAICHVRHNLTFRSSCNDGQDWDLLGSVWDGPSAYSSLVPLPWRSDALGVVFERGASHSTTANSTVYDRLTFTEIPIKLVPAPAPAPSIAVPA